MDIHSHGSCLQFCQRHCLIAVDRFGWIFDVKNQGDLILNQILVIIMMSIH